MPIHPSPTAPKGKGVVARFLFGSFCADERQRENPKSQAPNLRVSGVGFPAYALLSYGVASRCQGRKTKKLKPVEDPV